MDKYECIKTLTPRYKIRIQHITSVEKYEPMVKKKSMFNSLKKTGSPFLIIKFFKHALI